MSKEYYTESPLHLVNTNNIGSHVGERVVVHGKVKGMKNETLTLQTSAEKEGDEILVSNVSVNKEFPQNSLVKIIGQVNGDKSVEYIDSIKLNNDFDLNIVNEVIPIMEHREVAGMFFA